MIFAQDSAILKTIGRVEFFSRCRRFQSDPGKCGCPAGHMKSYPLLSPRLKLIPIATPADCAQGPAPDRFLRSAGEFKINLISLFHQPDGRKDIVVYRLVHHLTDL